MNNFGAKIQMFQKMSYKHSLILHMSNETFCVIFKHCETRGFYGISTDPWPLLPNLFDSITSTRTTEAFLLHMSSSSSSRVRQSFFADMDERETLLPKKTSSSTKVLTVVVTKWIFGCCCETIIWSFSPNGRRIFCLDNIEVSFKIHMFQSLNFYIV